MDTDGNIGGFLGNAIDAGFWSGLDAETQAAVGRAINEGVLDDMEAVPVALADLVLTQDWYAEHIALRNAEEVEAGQGPAWIPVPVVRRCGRLYLADGHHRFVGHALAGRTHIDAYLF